MERGSVNSDCPVPTLSSHRFDFYRLFDKDKFSEKYNIFQGEDVDKAMDILRESTIMAYSQACTVIGEIVSQPSTHLKAVGKIVAEKVQTALADIHPEWTIRLGQLLETISLNIVDDLLKLLQSCTDGWLIFWSTEFWSFYELGVVDFNAYSSYVLEKLQPTFGKYPVMLDLANSPAEPVIAMNILKFFKQVGYALYTAGMGLKNQLAQTVDTLNTEFDSCMILTPQVCYFQIARLKVVLRKLKKQFESQWALLRIASFPMVKMFIKDLTENLENNPDIDFPTTTGAKLFELKPFKKFLPTHNESSHLDAENSDLESKQCCNSSEGQGDYCWNSSGLGGGEIGEVIGGKVDGVGL